MENNKIRFATIGTNFVTDWFLEGVKSLPDAEHVAVYSRTEERGEEFAKKHGVNAVHTDISALCADECIDAVYIASPTSCHFQHAMELIKAGKHILCEKPVCTNSAEYEALKDAALKQGVVLMEAMKNVHGPNYHALKDGLSKLGNIRQANFSYCQYSSRYDKFKAGIIENAFIPELSNGALMDIGSYCVHFMVSLFGEPEIIKSAGTGLPESIDGAGTAICVYPGFIVNLTYSKINDNALPSQIMGENGNMLIEDVPIIKEVTINYRDGSRENIYADGIPNPMIYETKDFIECIRTGNIRHDDLENAGIAMRVMDEIRKQCNIIFPADIQ